MSKREYHFTECPINFHLWSREEKLKVHYFIVSKALEFSRSTPFLDFSDFYNAGFIGYLKATKKLTWTIHNNGISYTCSIIMNSMRDEWATWYGRPGSPKYDAKRKALFSQTSLDSPMKEN